MKLSELSEKNPLIRDFSNRLAKSTKQPINSTQFNKIKRVSGVSALPVDFHLAHGQNVTIYLRLIEGNPDIFRIDVNDKQLPTTGDFSNDYKPSFNKSVDEIANVIVKGQSNFDKKRTAVKTASTSSRNNTSQRQKLADLTQQIGEIDSQIQQKQAEKQALIDQLDALKMENVIGLDGGGQIMQFDSAKSAEQYDFAPESLPSSANIETMRGAITYWQQNFENKKYRFTIQRKKQQPIDIVVDFGTTNHAYTEKPEGASHRNEERVFNQERAVMMDKIFSVIRQPSNILVSKDNELFIERLIKGQHYIVVLTWREMRQVYDFQSAHFKKERQIEFIKRNQDIERKNYQETPIVKHGKHKR